MTYCDEDFLLDNDRARELYHVWAKPQPIIDFHCHLDPIEIASDRHFDNLTQLWLAGDHYKWRAMRAAGVDEQFITGSAPDREKFQRWAETVPKTLRNPLYHFTHLELRRCLGITNALLDGTTAARIWEDCQARLSTSEYSTHGLLERMNVEVLCTTDDPTSDLSAHRQIANSNLSTRVLPTFRPDRILDVSDPKRFMSTVEELHAAAGLDVRDFRTLLMVLDQRHAHFDRHGCRLADHGLEALPTAELSLTEAAHAYTRLQRGEHLEPHLAGVFQSTLLHELALLNHHRGWTQQLHVGALRGANTRLTRQLGPDTGYDAISDQPLAHPLREFLDRLEQPDRLAKTIVYNLNPRDNDLVVALLGGFADPRIRGKMQYGAAWWFLDQLSGITRQLDALSSLGLLGEFVGMVTDSRSFLSFPRHEYFRRILCNLLGEEMTRGLVPDDLCLVGTLVSNISYHNAKRFFGFDNQQPH